MKRETETRKRDAFVRAAMNEVSAKWEALDPEERQRRLRDDERRREIGEMFEDLEFRSGPDRGELEFVLDASEVIVDDGTVVGAVVGRRYCFGCGIFKSDGSFEESKRCRACAKRHVAWYFRVHGHLRLPALQARSPHGPNLQSDFTDDGWRRILAAFGHRCAYCGGEGDPLEQEHVIAISLGGHDLLSNLVPACESCNSSKHASELDDWLKRKGKRFEREARERIARAASKLVGSAA
jgi:5-methylcytosine-specific restriction endonuclease McrA